MAITLLSHAAPAFRATVPSQILTTYLHAQRLSGPLLDATLLQAADQHRSQRRHPHAKPLLQGHMAMKHTSHTQPACCLRSQLSLRKPERLSNHGDCGRKSRKEEQRDSTQQYVQRKTETIALTGVICPCSSGEV